MLQQRELTLQSPAIACQIAVLSYYTMAWHHHGDWICGARSRHRSNRLWFPDCPRQLAVRPRRAVRNLTQFFPHSSLKRSCLHVGRQIEVRFAPAQVLQYFPHPSFQTISIALDFRAWIFLSQRALQRSIIFPQVQGTNPAIRRGNEQSSERRSHDRVMNLHSRSASPVGSGRHSRSR